MIIPLNIKNPQSLVQCPRCETYIINTFKDTQGVIWEFCGGICGYAGPLLDKKEAEKEKRFVAPKGERAKFVMLV